MVAVPVADFSETQPGGAGDARRRWLGASPLIDLEDPKLRLRVRALTQLAKDDREKALAVFGFVKRLPMARRFKLRLRTARQVLDAGRGDAPDKATLLVAMLRIAGLPARIRYVAMRGEILRGLTSHVRQAARPMVEARLHGRWVRTDTYIFDATYMAAARQRLKDHGWDWGYGIHVHGEMMWDGREDAFVGGPPVPANPMVVGELGVFDDPLEFTRSQAFRQRHAPAVRVLHWNVLAPVMQHTIRRLRRDLAPAPAPATGRRPS
jgi:hypothetical protein